MISKEYCQLMAKYNQWMNERLYAICGNLSEPEYKLNRGLFFGSIEGTLNHLLYGDIAWMSRFMGRENEVPQLGEILYTDLSSLHDARIEWDEKIINWTNDIDDTWLSGDFTFVSKVDGKTRSDFAWVYVTHMFNHGAHHRGQLTAVLSQMDIEYGSTDIPFMPR